MFYTGDLIDPTQGWFVDVAMTESGDGSFRGQAKIRDTGFSFNTIALSRATDGYAGAWSPFSRMELSLADDGCTARGSMIYNRDYDPMQVPSLSLWTRISEDPTVALAGSTGRSISGDDAIAELLSGRPVVAATIEGPLNGVGVEFPLHVSLIDCVVTGPANFTQAKFAAGLDFSESEFNGPFTFVWGEVLGDAQFAKSTYRSSALFSYAQFKANGHSTVTVFVGASFWGSADFKSVVFDGPTSFTAATLSGEASFVRAKFLDIDFRDLDCMNMLDLSHCIGQTVYLGGLRAQDLYCDNAEISGRLSIESDYAFPIGRYTSSRQSRIVDSVSVAGSNIQAVVLRDVVIGRKASTVGSSIGELTAYQIDAPMVDLWGAKFASNVKTDGVSARRLHGRYQQLFPEHGAASEFDEEVFQALVESFKSRGLYREMNLALLDSKYAEWERLKRDGALGDRIKWIGAFLIGFGISGRLAALWATAVCLVFAAIYWLLSRTAREAVVVANPQREQLSFWLRRPPIEVSMPDGAESSASWSSMREALYLSLAAFAKINFGRRFVVQHRSLSIVIWVEWLIGYLYLYALVLSIVSTYPLARELFGLR